MIFSKKKNKKEGKYEIENYKEEKKLKERLPSSYQRAVPMEDEITTKEEIKISNCPMCDTPLINKKKKIKYIEDIRVAEE
jgi:hypothetical protein